MKANLTAILAVAGVAAALASPAAAQSRVVYVPVQVPDATVRVAPPHGPRGEAVAPRHGAVFGRVPGVNGVGPYTPGIPSPRYGDNGDFQTGESR